MTDAPFWSDDFDMDLPKVIPGARELLGDMADVEMKTHCTAPTFGRLNHPCVWNHDAGCIAFFGFLSPRKPEVYWTNAGIQTCTAWEAFRDIWAHHILMMVEERPVWNTALLHPQFETIMWDIRGWRSQEVAANAARDVVRSSIQAAVMRLRAIRGPS